MWFRRKFLLFSISWLLQLHAIAGFDTEDCPFGLLIRTQKVTATANGKTLVTPAGGRFRNFSMRDYSFGKDGKYQTKLYFPLRGATPENATAVVGLLHGMNAESSQAGSMFNGMNALTKLDKNIEKGSPLDEARKRGKRVDHVYAEAIDQPGCGNNCDLKTLTYEGLLDFYAEYFRDLRQRAPGKPVIAVGFCYSAGFLLEVNRRNPGLIDGLVLTGLIVPDPKIGFDFAAGVETRMYQDGTLIENPAVHSLADKAYLALPWSNVAHPNGNTPTLLLIGKNDPFQSPEAIQWFSQWAQRSGENLVFRHIEGAGHGVLGPVEGFPESFISVLADMNQLIGRTIHEPPK